ncbi:MAG: pentapeptide repeat-containing protein [Zoogloeaceae bacterium]|nr:pentapeptide repeat-containing protein [Zoogloeaceae bacterium]
MTSPFVVTFYSYKGGVGRTLLAANVGYLLARGGKTLLWDLDIEAPGLHFVEGIQPESPVERGFFEWLEAWQRQRRPASAREYKALVKLARPCPISERLFVLPAFADGADFAALFQQIDWKAFLADDLDAGLTLFRGALAAFGDAGYEFILLDSRTGITDIGGVLAALLPHVTVLVGNFSRQNTKGLAHVWQALDPAAQGRLSLRGDLPALRRILVASPIPNDSTKLIAAGHQVWTEAFGIERKEIIQIPWTGKLLFAEELLASREPESPVTKAYGLLADALRRQQEDNAAAARDTARGEAAYADLLPGKRGSRAEQGKRFEERVAHLLRLLGYQVEAEQLVDSNRVDLVARKRGDFGRPETYLIECKEHRDAVQKAVIETLHKWLDGPAARQMQARGMVVASHDFSPAARGYARDHGLQALTFDELERSLFDFSPYLARIRQRYESSALAHTYVAQCLTLEDSDAKTPVELLPHAVQWAGGTGSRLWLVLGDYGTGKSAFVERFAYELAKACEEDRDAPIPIAINLKFFPNAISLESLIREHLEAELRTVLSPEVALHLLEAGRVVLLLDSFDEMGVAQAGRSIEEQFRQLARPTASPGRDARGNRILVTSRSHFFRDSRSARQAAQGNSDALFEPESLLGKVARSFDATIDELPAFTEAQVREYLARRLGQVEGEQAWERIGQIYGLRELAATPQLLEMIVTSLPELMAGGRQVTRASLYLSYTNRWLDTVRLARAEVSTEHLRALLERVASELWSRPQNRIHYAELAQLLRETPGLARHLDSERVDLELRTAAFLVRTPDGHYRFSHRSFLEFFVARNLYRCFKAGAIAGGFGHGRLNRETIGFFLDMLGREEAENEQLDGQIRALLAAPYQAGVSENALVLACRCAHWRVDAEAGETRSQGVRADELWYAAHRRLIPDAAQLQGARLAGTDLDLVWLVEADLRGADLSQAGLFLADLRRARLDGATLDDCDLRGAILTGAHLPNARAQRLQASQAQANQSDWQAADLHGADLRKANLSDANFSGASLRLARLAGARCPGARFDGTRLDGATWPDAQGLPSQKPARPGRPAVQGLPGHGDRLTACAFALDGQTVLTASADRTARLWDAATGQELRRFDGHQASVTACAFAHDGQTVLTASHDGTARLWDAATGQELRRFEGHQASVTACAFAHDGRTVLTASADRTARLWDVATGQELRRFEGHQDWHNACAFAPDGQTLLTAYRDGTARLWDAATSQELRVMAAAGPSWIAWTRQPCRWDGAGELAEVLLIVDEADMESPATPDSLPTLWRAADLPDLKGLLPLP